MEDNTPTQEMPVEQEKTEIKRPIFKSNRRFAYLKWWLFTCTTLMCCYLLYMADFFSDVYNKDSTKICFIIMGIYAYYSVMAGRFSLVLSRAVDLNGMLVIDCDIEFKDKWIGKIKPMKFWSDQLLSLGMLGTVIGFIMVMNNGFSTFDPSNTSSIYAMVKMISAGISTALYTTLIGLIFGILLKIQYFYLLRTIEEA